MIISGDIKVGRLLSKKHFFLIRRQNAIKLKNVARSGGTRLITVLWWQRQTDLHEFMASVVHTELQTSKNHIVRPF